MPVEGTWSMDQHIALVKRQIAWLVDQTTRYTPGQSRYRADLVAMYERLLTEHRDLLSFLESLRLSGMAAPAPASPQEDAGRKTTSDDLSDLPEELLSELSGRAAKGSNDPLVQIIADRGGIANIDEILIDLYRKHHQIGKRVLIQNKLYRLSKQGSVWTMPGRKGVYTTKPPETPGPEA